MKVRRSRGCPLFAFAWVTSALVAALNMGCATFHRGALPGEPAGNYTTLQGARVHYTDSAQKNPADASKPAAVLIHGFAASLDTWNAVAPRIAKTHRVVALDLKGFGFSDRPAGDYSPDAEAQIVLALMDHLQIARATLVAHSWGSSVALAAALREPARVRRLAMYDAWVYEEQLPVFFQWARAGGVGEALFSAYYKERADDRMALAFYDKSYITEGLVDSVDAALDRPGAVAAALAAVRDQRYADVQERYRTIAAKTLLLWGREDLVTRLSFGERLAATLPSAKLVVYPRCGHFPMIEAFDASTRDLTAFLAEDAQEAEHESPPTAAAARTHAAASPETSP